MNKAGKATWECRCRCWEERNQRSEWKEDETVTCGMLFDGPVFANLLFQGLVITKQRSSQNEKTSKSKGLVSAAFLAPSADCSLALTVSLQAESKKVWREVGMCLKFQCIINQFSWSAKIQRCTQFILKSKGQGSSESESQGDDRNSQTVLALHSAMGLQWTCSKAPSHLSSFSWQALFYREGLIFPSSFCGSKITPAKWVRVLLKKMDEN